MDNNIFDETEDQESENKIENCYHKNEDVDANDGDDSCQEDVYEDSSKTSLTLQLNSIYAKLPSFTG